MASLFFPKSDGVKLNSVNSGLHVRVFLSFINRHQWQKCTVKAQK